MIDLPQSDEAERSVLGAILVDNQKLREVEGLLAASDFFSAVHQQVFGAMLALQAAGKPLDLLTISEQPGMAEVLDIRGGPAYLSRLMDGIPRMMNVPHYAEIVRDRSVRRALIQHGQELCLKAVDEDLPDVLGWSAKREAELAAGLVHEEDKTFDSALGEALDDIEARQRAGGPTGLLTGFKRLDEFTAGMEPGDLIFVAGNTSSGKTSFALCVLRHVQFVLGRHVVMYSMEMNARLVAMRIACQEAGLNILDVRGGRMSDWNWDQLTRVYRRLAKSTLIIKDRSSVTAATILAECRKRKAKVGLDLIVVDQIGNMTPDRSAKDRNREQDVAGLSRSLKAIARELEVPVLALHQLNRQPQGGASGKKRRPLISDMRDSGNTEGDADSVWLVYREDQGEVGKPKTGRAEIIVGKQRNGPTGPVSLLFDDKCATFRDPLT